MTALRPGSEAVAADPAFILAFPSGSRPDRDTVEALFASDGLDGFSAVLSHLPAPEQGWVEILASGLTFDLCGLQPASAILCPDAPHHYGFASVEPMVPAGEAEAIRLEPAGHIVAGAALSPVIRTMAGLAANLASHLPVSAVLWPPARSVMAPDYFVRLVLNWLAGGTFPALGLTSLACGSDGSVASVGLGFFTGIEMQLEAGQRGDRAADFKLAVRVIDYLVEKGVPSGEEVVTLGGEALLFEPSRQGKRVWVWRAD